MTGSIPQQKGEYAGRLRAAFRATENAGKNTDPRPNQGKTPRRGFVLTSTGDLALDEIDQGTQCRECGAIDFVVADHNPETLFKRSQHTHHRHGIEFRQDPQQPSIVSKIQGAPLQTKCPVEDAPGFLPDIEQLMRPSDVLRIIRCRIARQATRKHRATTPATLRAAHRSP